MRKRIEWVDIGKYICIMFVMLSHLECGTDELRTFYAPFFLTVFFFLAGYVYRQPGSFKEHLYKKAKGLLLPWFIFSNLNILLSAIMTFKGNRNITTEIMWNLVQIRPLGDGLWFISALFVAFIPFYFIIKMNNRKKAITIAAILAILSNIYTIYMPDDFFPWGNNALPWHLEYFFKAMLWMVLGYYYKNEFENILDKYNTWINTIILTVVYLIIVYIPLEFSNDIIQMLFQVYVKSIIGIIVIIMYCKKIKSNKYISYVGANTIIYFALHGKILAIIEHGLASKANNFYQVCLENGFYSSLLAIAITIILSFVLIIPAYIINRWFPWTVGRKKKIK